MVNDPEAGWLVGQKFGNCRHFPRSVVTFSDLLFKILHYTVFDLCSLILINLLPILLFHPSSFYCISDFLHRHDFSICTVSLEGLTLLGGRYDL